MVVVEYFQLTFITGILLSLTCLLWTLNNIIFKTLKKSSTNGVKFGTVSLWQSVKLLVSIFKWYFLEDYATKRYFVEELCLQLKSITPTTGSKIFSVFNFNIVVNDDFESITNNLHNKKSSIKIPAVLRKILSNGKTNAGITLNHGPIWKELRKYTVKKLGQLGFGKSDHLSLILSDLLPDLLNHLENIKITTNNKIPIRNLFNLYVINVVWCTIGGKKFSEKDEKYVKLYNNTNVLLNFPVFHVYLLSCLPNYNFIKHLFGYEKVYERIEDAYNYFGEFIEEKKYLLETKAAPEDFVELFILEIERHKDNDELKHIYTKDQLMTVLADFFVGGLATTSKYLELFLMYMILNPEVQRKIHEEIDLVVPENVIPSYSDHRQSMPYMYSTMLEVHRMGSVSPAITRYLPKEVNCTEKYSQGAALIINLMWAIRMDETFWGDPHSFRPERFLNADSTFITEKINRVMPFGAGSRICPAENVANASSFAFLVSILKTYRVTKATRDEVLGIAKEFRAFTQTLPFHISLDERLL